MFKEASVLLLFCIALSSTEPRRQQDRSIVSNNALVSPNHPYIYLRVPGRRTGGYVQGFEYDDDYSKNDAMISVDKSEVTLDENDEDEAAKPPHTLALDENHAEEDDANFTSAELEDTHVLKKIPSNMRKNINPQHISEEDDDKIDCAELGDAQTYTPKPSNKHKNMKPPHMMISGDHTGPVLLPDNFIGHKAHTIIDRKTGELSLMVPRDVFEALPGGSIVTMMARSFDESQARANRVIVRRRRRRNGFGVNLNGSRGNRNSLLPGGNNPQRRINANNNVRIIRRNVYGRPVAQNNNRRPVVQPNNRRRVKFA